MCLKQRLREFGSDQSLYFCILVQTKPVFLVQTRNSQTFFGRRKVFAGRSCQGSDNFMEQVDLEKWEKGFRPAF